MDAPTPSPPAAANPPPPTTRPETPAPAGLLPAGHSVIFAAEQAPGLLKAVCFGIPDDITGYWTPSAADLDGVEQTLPDYLLTQKASDRHWAEFYRQVAGVLRGDARFLFLNYFVMTGRPRGGDESDQPGVATDGWKTSPYWVNDGGDWYFRVLYDVGRKKFVWYEHNNQA